MEEERIRTKPIGERIAPLVQRREEDLEEEEVQGGHLIHELAHSVLNVGHKGGVKRIYDCDTSLGLTIRPALKNAYAYEGLALCFSGLENKGTTTVGKSPKKAKKNPGMRAHP